MIIIEFDFVVFRAPFQKLVVATSLQSLRNDFNFVFLDFFFRFWRGAEFNSLIMAELCVAGIYRAAAT